MGAWLLKANPAVWDVLGALASGDGLASWRLTTSYRVELVRPGHPCVLWVTGGRRAATTGAWAVGTIAGDPYEDVGDPEDPGWADPVQARQVRPYVATRLDVFARPVRLETLAEDPRFARAEIIRAPRVASPGALRPEEFAALLEARDRLAAAAPGDAAR